MPIAGTASASAVRVVMITSGWARHSSRRPTTVVPSHPVSVLVADRSAGKGAKWGSVIVAATSGSTASVTASPTVTILSTAGET